MRFNSFSFLTLGVTALLLSACGGGGGGNENPTKVKITAVKTAGDSLLDVGALSGVDASLNKGLGTGRIFSVNSSSEEPYVIWSERINKILGLSDLCSYYSIKTNFGTTPSCGSFAIGGAVINKTNAALNDAFSINKQLSALGQQGIKSTDLVLIDGGGNDASALIGAFLKAGSDSGASFATLTRAC